MYIVTGSTYALGSVVNMGTSNVCVPALSFEAIPFDHQSQNWRKFLNPNWCLLLVRYWLALMTSKVKLLTSSLFLCPWELLEHWHHRLLLDGLKNWGSGFCASLFFLTHMVENLQHLWKAGSAAKYFLIWCSQGPASAAGCVHLHNYNFVSLLRSIVGDRWYPSSTRAVMSSRWVYTSVNIDVMKREIS
jgi:hypothetical protein